MSFSDDEFGYTPLRSMRPTHILGRGLGLAAAAVLFALMVLTFIDVIGRYVFSAPLPSAFELTELSMGILSFLGLPLVSARRGHIAISLVDRLIGRRGRRLQQIVVNLLAALAFAFLTWRMWMEAGKLAEVGEYTPYLYAPLAPFVYFMTVSSAVAVAIFLGIAWHHIRGSAKDTLV